MTIRAKPDVQKRLRLHAETTREAKELIARGHALQQKGKTAQARRLLKQIERLAKRLEELEG